MGLIQEKAAAGKIPAIEAVLEDPEWAGVTLMDTDIHENTLLHIACIHGHTRLTTWLLTKGLDVNAINVAGDTPLILAVTNGSLELVKILVENGANVDKGNDHGNTAIHYACFWRHKEIAEFLAFKCNTRVAIKNKFQRTPLMRTSKEIIDLLSPLVQGQTIIQVPTRSYAQAKEESKMRFLAQDNQWEVHANTIHVQETLLVTNNFTHSTAQWNGNDVVLKVTLSQEFTRQELEAIRKEVASIRKLFHTNLMPLLAATLKPPHVGILTEYATAGDAYTFLHDPSMELEPDQAIRMAIEVAKGLQFLHESGSAHGNLKSSNVMLFEDGSVRLMDYAWFRSRFSRFNGNQSMLYDVEWLPREVLRDGLPNVDDMRAVQAMDLYAFGMLLHEIVTRQYPYDGMNAMQTGVKVLFENVSPTIPDYIPEQLASIMQKCWNPDPFSRPEISAVLTSLQKFQSEGF